MNFSEFRLQYAGFWRRTGAYILDCMILLGTLIMMGTLFFDIDPTQTPWFNFIEVVFIWLYFSLLESSTLQATIGKIVFHIIVTDEYGNRISFGRATGRHFGKYISAFICLIGFIMVGFTEKKQALHDNMAGTLVIRK